MYKNEIPQRVFIRLFIAFLKKEKVFNEFIFNRSHLSIYDKTFVEFLDDVKPSAFLTSAFWWRSTKEKYDFWHDINVKWYTICQIIYKPNKTIDKNE